MWPMGSLMEPMDLLACYSCPGFPRWDTRDLESRLGILELYKGTPNRAKGLTDGGSLSVLDGLKVEVGALEPPERRLGAFLGRYQ